MTIYSKQDNHTSCGPTALGNALKFLQIGSYHRLKNKLKKLSNYQPGVGVWIKDFHLAGKKLAEEYFFSFKKMPKPSFTKMVEALENGYGLLVVFRWVSQDGGHLVFVHGIGDKNKLATANDTKRDYYESSVAHRLTSRDTWKRRIRRGGFSCWKVGF